MLWDHPISHKDTKYSIFLLHNFLGLPGLEFQVVVIQTRKMLKNPIQPSHLIYQSATLFAPPSMQNTYLKILASTFQLFRISLKGQGKIFLNIKQSCLSISIKLKKPSSCSTSQNVALSKLRRYVCRLGVSPILRSQWRVA